MTDVVESVQLTNNMTNLKTAHKRKDRFRLYHVIKEDFSTIVGTKIMIA